MHKLTAQAVLTGLVFFAASVASAQTTSHEVSLTPFAGGYTFDGAQSLKSEPVYGLRLGYGISDNWDVEALFDYVSTRPKSGSGDANAYNYRIEGLYNFFPETNLVPFLAIGAGGNTVEYPDSTGEGTKTRLALAYGGGLKYFFSESWALRADLRHLLVAEKSNRVLGNLEYALGLSYFFGQKAAPAPLDSDGDGVLDYMDKCPGTPMGVKVNSDGCPLDTDGDGVLDYLDKCPGTPMGVKVDSDGCPVPVIEKKSMTLNIEFDTAKADIRPEYYGEIKKVADLMAAYPDINIMIEGHTDNVGSKSYNDKLSTMRAESVRKYLVEKFGIAQERLGSAGYGPARPIADNATAEGRQRNRRIEAVINYTVTR